MSVLVFRLVRMLNWSEEKLMVRVIGTLGQEKVLFDEVIKGVRSKNALKIDIEFQHKYIRGEDNKIVVQIASTNEEQIGNVDIDINPSIVEGDHYCYLPVQGSQVILEVLVRDAHSHGKYQIARECIDLLEGFPRLRQKRQEEFENTNRFIQERQMSLEKYCSNKHTPIRSKHNLKQLIVQLKGIGRDLRQAEQSQASQQFLADPISMPSFNADKSQDSSEFNQVYFDRDSSQSYST